MRFSTMTVAAILVAAAAWAGGERTPNLGQKKRQTEAKAAFVAATNDVASWVQFTNAVAQAKNFADLQTKLLAWGVEKEKAAKEKATATAAGAVNAAEKKEGVE